MFLAKDIISLLKLPHEGNTQRQFSAFKTLVDAGVEHISYAEPKFKQALIASKAGLVITTPQLAEFAPYDVIISQQPREDFAKILRHYFPEKKPTPGIHPTAIIHEDAKIGCNVSIGPFCIIGAKVSIGDGVCIKNHVVIEKQVEVGANTIIDDHVVLHTDTIIGQACRLAAGCVIGSAGFGFVRTENGWDCYPQIAGVVIEDNVDIGAKTTIDRGSLAQTHIANNVKIDNQVHIAHGVKIGRNTIIAGCGAIAGTTEIGENCMFGGCVAIADNIRIVSGVILGGLTGVSKNIDKPGLYSNVSDVESYQALKRKEIRLNKLDQWLQKHQLKDLSNENI